MDVQWLLRLASLPHISVHVIGIELERIFCKCAHTYQNGAYIYTYRPSAAIRSYVCLNVIYLERI